MIVNDTYQNKPLLLQTAYADNLFSVVGNGGSHYNLIFTSARIKIEDIVSRRIDTGEHSIRMTDDGTARRGVEGGYRGSVNVPPLF